MVRLTRARIVHFMPHSYDAGQAIVKQFRSSLKDNKNDIHAKMMSRYPEAPEWW